MAHSSADVFDLDNVCTIIPQYLGAERCLARQLVQPQNISYLLPVREKDLGL